MREQNFIADPHDDQSRYVGAVEALRVGGQVYRYNRQNTRNGAELLYQSGGPAFNILLVPILGECARAFFCCVCVALHTHSTFAFCGQPLACESVLI